MNEATITVSYKNLSGTTTISSELNEGTVEHNLEEENIPGATTGRVLPPMVVNLTDLKAFAIGCRKTSTTLTGGTNEGTTQLVVKTYLASVLKNTFTITPANGVGWSLGFPTANPLTSNFDEIRVDNVAPSGSTAPVAAMDFSGRFLSE